MRAEDEFREAFERLKRGESLTMPPGTEVSQNNVAREAGKDPSALKKQRFPRLISEIQAYVGAHAPVREPSRSAIAQGVRRRNRTLREKLVILKSERDMALSMLVEADTVILRLQAELDGLKRKQEKRDKAK